MIIETLKQLNKIDDDISYKNKNNLRNKKINESVSVLNESIDDSYEYYKDIKREDFDRVIRLDPTFREEDDRLGTYGKWLLQRFRDIKKGTLKDREFEDRITEILFDFDNRKRFLNNAESKGEGKEANKGTDITQYKSADEIRAALDCIELTNNQRMKKNREAKHHSDLGEEAVFIAENNNYEIWKPLTYNASCRLGSGTHWCTASTSNDNWYHHYADNGALYIFIPKKEGEDKIQLHIDKNNRVTDFKKGSTDSAWKWGKYEGFMEFVEQENFLDTLLKTEIGNCDAINIAVQKRRLEAGETYQYKGEDIPSELRKAIKELDVIGPLDNNAIPNNAFKDCEEMIKCNIPGDITAIGVHAFYNCNDNLVISTTPHKMRCYDRDKDWIVSHIKWER